MLVTQMLNIVCIRLHSWSVKICCILNIQYKKYVKRVAAGNCQTNKWMIGNWRQCQWLDWNGLVKRLYSLLVLLKDSVANCANIDCEYVNEYFVIWYRCKYIKLINVLQCETVFARYIVEWCKALHDNNSAFWYSMEKKLWCLTDAKLVITQTSNPRCICVLSIETKL